MLLEQLDAIWRLATKYVDELRSIVPYYFGYHRMSVQKGNSTRNFPSGAVDFSIDVVSGTRGIAMSPDGRVVALLAVNGSSIVFVDAVEVRVLSTVDVAPVSLRTLEFSKDGSRLVCAGGD